MGQTLAEKILTRNSGAKDAKTGDIVIAKPAMVMFHDIYTSFVKEKFESMGFKKVWDPEKVTLILDHTSPTNGQGAPIALNDGFDFARKYGIKKVHHGIGIGHTMMHVLGYARPGEVVLVTDSHTTTYGGGGCFGTGIGYTEMAAVLGTGELWLRIPTAIKVVVDGELPRGVYAKDFILKLLGDIKADGAQYKSLEFTGEAVRKMDMDSRYTIANMALEAGAKSALFEADEKTAEYFGMDLEDIDWVKMDDDAVYEHVLRYNASELEPQLACPGAVDNVSPLAKSEGTKLTQVVIGSCTNSSLDDIAIAAKILKGKKVPEYLRFYVSTASNKVTKEAMKRGYVRTLMEAGAIFGAPTCQSCCGMIARMGDDDVCLGTNNRNFLGRHGTRNTKLYLGSPAAAAASALTGRITDPRKYVDPVHSNDRGGV